MIPSNPLLQLACLFGASVVFLAQAGYGQSDDKAALALIERINGTFFDHDHRAEDTLSTAFKDVSEGTMSDAWRYTYGLWQYRRGSLVPPADTTTTEGLKHAVDILAKVQPGPFKSEAEGLRSAVMGLLAGKGGMVGGMRYGTGSQSAAAKALKMDPENPRVLLFAGINKSQTPAMWGGDRKEAVELFKKAIARFELQKPDAPLKWGEAETYLWMGNTYWDLNDFEAAKAAFLTALRVQPNFKYVEKNRLKFLALDQQKAAAKTAPTN